MKQKENKEINLIAIGGGIIVVLVAAIVLIFSGIMKHDSPVTTGKPSGTDDSAETENSAVAENQEQNSDDLPDDSSEEEHVSYHLYILILEKETEDQTQYSDGHAAVYDADGDGIDELLIIAAYPSSDQQPPFVAYSVYDIEDGEVVNRINRELLYYEAGGPDGYFGISEYEGKTYFHVNKDNGETGYGAARRTTESLLNPEDLSVSLSTVTEYVTEEEREDTGCTINGTEAELSECQNTVSKITPTVACKVYSEDNVNCNSFADMIALLKEAE